MRAEQLALGLRPRPMFEAADLGVRMTQQAAPTLLRAWLPLALMLLGLCGATLELAAWLPSALLWLFKPWLDRGLLHIYARQAFGEPTRFAEAWAARGAAPWGPLLYQLTLARLSPWRAYTMPVRQLEGQTGRARRQRIRQLLAGHQGAVLMLQFVCANVEFLLFTALVSLAIWFLPGLEWSDFTGLVSRDDHSLPVGAALFAAYAAMVLFVEPFYVAAGFCMYLNRRVELEAWDVEQALREAFPEGAS